MKSGKLSLATKISMRFPIWAASVVLVVGRALWVYWSCEGAAAVDFWDLAALPGVLYDQGRSLPGRIRWQRLGTFAQ